MPTDPLTGSRYPQGSDVPDVAKYIEYAVKDLSDNTIPDHATTTARDNAWAAWVALGNAMRNGLHTVVNGVRYRRIGGTWRVDRNRNIVRTAAISGGSIAIGSGGSAETGVTSGVTMNGGNTFTLYEAGTVSINAAMRAGPTSLNVGAALCYVKVNGSLVGNVASSRSDSTVTCVAAIALAAGTHSVSLRVDANSGSCTWVDGIVTITEGIAE